MRIIDILSIILTLIFAFVLVTFIFVWWDIGVTYQKFEDGSGVIHISYCYPGGACYDERDNSDPGFEQLEAENAGSSEESGEQTSTTWANRFTYLGDCAWYSNGTFSETADQYHRITKVITSSQ